MRYGIIIWAVFLASIGNVFAETAEDAWNRLSGGRAKVPVYAFVKNDPNLPNVFIYGDSISIHYTLHVKDQLKGKANVYRLPGNGNNSSFFIPSVSRLNEGMRDPKIEGHWSFKWDVIHLNVGVHDLRLLKDGPKGKKTEPVHTLAEYEQNLRGIFSYLKKTEPHATIVFATTTPIPEGSPEFRVGDSAKYNEVARKVIKDFPGVIINDLYEFTKPNQDKWKRGEGDVHFNLEGRVAQGNEVARVILQCLKTDKSGSADMATAPRTQEADGVPQNVEDLWAGYDASKEPLEVKLIREWQKDSITYRYITYTIGTFKGKKSTMAAFYGFPTDHQGKLPALIQMHGGGQRASLAEVTYGAKNGYAVLSINWLGREMEEAKPGDPTTDWGAVDPTQQGHNSHYFMLTPDEKTLDDIESPRNSNWYLIVIAAQRGVTFLQQQPQVNADRIGAFGHSMGGMLTVLLAGSDKRIKAAVPSCGGAGEATDEIRNRPNPGVRPAMSELYHKTIDEARYLERINIPMLYQGPQNDFNGSIDNMYANWHHLKSKTVNYSIPPHLNHKFTPEHRIVNMLFFDDHLKGTFDFPATPKIQAVLTTQSGLPIVQVVPDQGQTVAKVVFYYSMDEHIKTRFWHTVNPSPVDNKWIAELPVVYPGCPLYIIVNVYYILQHPIVAHPIYKGKAPETFGISSEMLSFTAEQVAAGGMKTSCVSNRMIQEDFNDLQDWSQAAWYLPSKLSISTRKVKDPTFRGPDGAELLLDVKTDKDIQVFITVQDNSWNAFPGKKTGTFTDRFKVKATGDWQTLKVRLEDFKPTGKWAKEHPRLESWRYLTELCIDGINWDTPRMIRNLHWEGGSYPEDIVLQH